MEFSIKDKKKMLVSRLKSNFDAFKFSLNGVSREKLIEMAGRIAAVTEAYETLTQYYDWDEEELDFFLLFRDPLTIVSDALENRNNEMGDNFEDAMFDVAYSDKILSEYPLIDGVDASLYDRIIPFHYD